MKRRLLLVVLVGGTFSAKAAIDFTPTVSSYVSEGAEYATVKFKDDKRNVSIILPRLWSCRGDGSHLQFTPPKESLAEGAIQATPTKGVLRFDEATVKSLEQRVLAELPAGSQAGTIVSQQENPVLIYQNLSYEFVLSYKALGQTFQKSVIFVSCPDEVLIFKFSAPQAAFDSLNRSFRQSICSWEWIEPSVASDLKTASK